MTWLLCLNRVIYFNQISKINTIINKNLKILNANKACVVAFTNLLIILMQ